MFGHTDLFKFGMATDHEEVKKKENDIPIVTSCSWLRV